MKMHHAILAVALLAALPAVAQAERGLQAEDLVSMDRYSSPVLSPDGQKLVFAKRVVDMDANKASTSLWIEDLFARDAAPPSQRPPRNAPRPCSKGRQHRCTEVTRRVRLRRRRSTCELPPRGVAGSTRPRPR